ncbi:phenylacetate--CoA ligase family protein [Flammeovirga sp. SJP92]|uniref:phenylacetate--CoA ligase family protein n=1 Tax=Flammeovirga sp. SJP92 TaxID=1775430 RepID=UPI0007896979|nr:AMP-binding protein [Flammeovirga sp. SJP92]KXX71682.1 phenylacetate--CoA ligase [Flammeovirga sp. SJP92]
MFQNLDTKSVEEIKAYQEIELQKLVHYVYAQSPFYKKVFDEHQLTPNAIQTLEDLQQLPVTQKEDLNGKEEDFLCIPTQEIAEYFTTSGTLGDPITFMYSENDLERLAYNEATSFEGIGINNKDIIQLMTTVDKGFMAGIAYYLGARKLNAGFMRVGPGVPQMQWNMIQKIKPTTLIVVPSFIPHLVEFAQKNNIDYKNSSVKRLLCIGEPVRNQDFTLNALGAKIASLWDVELFSTYASTEMGTAFTECEAKRGGHHHPELLIVELLDENNKVVEDGEKGEVTITTLGITGMPLLRFKTGDIAIKHTEKCSCGRTTFRLSPILGRKNHQVKFKGTTLYPPKIEDTLHQIKGVENFVIEVSKNEIEMDDLHVLIGAQINTKAFISDIKEAFQSNLRVTPKISVKTPKEIQGLMFRNNSRKPVRFFDLR